MKGDITSGSVIVEPLDRQLMRALQINPRAPFSLLGQVLGVAEQTVARRFNRLRRDGLMRVTAGIDPHALGLTTWLVRARCRPEATAAVADALARREDVSWVSIHSAGWEVVFSLRSRADTDAEDLLIRLLPKTAPVLDVSAAAILHTYVGGNPADWRGWQDALTQAQATRLRPEPSPTRSDLDLALLRPDDTPLLDLLTRDGRASYATLARATASTMGRVRRRLEVLTAAGVIYFDVDLAPAATGANATTTLWLTVTPRHLASTGEALATYDNIPFAAALTGPANLSATLTATDLEDTYHFVTQMLATLDGITGYELAPQLRRVKQSGALVTAGRLTTPPPTRSGAQWHANSTRTR